MKSFVEVGTSFLQGLSLHFQADFARNRPLRFPNTSAIGRQSVRHNVRRRKISIGLGTAGLAALLLLLYVNFGFGARREAAYWAADRGDSATLKKLLDSGVSANAYVYPENPHWMWLVHQFESPQDVGAKDPLIEAAASSGKVEEVKLLLSRGADPTACVPGGSTALMTAGANNNYPMVKLLLDRGADPYCCWKDGSMAE